jgi:putative Mn2+ efflux pump MntP
MDLISVLFIAVGLSMDACAVAIARGTVLVGPTRTRMVVTMAFLFGLFQAVMPIVGWVLGSTFSGLIEGVDHWIAFFLLAGIGGKMIYEGRADMSSDHEPDLSIKVLLLLAIATSIDALAVGIGLAVLATPIIEPAVLIGGVTFALTLIGGFVGIRFGERFGKRMEILGGVVLIAIGLRILLSHLVLGP